MNDSQKRGIKDIKDICKEARCYANSYVLSKHQNLFDEVYKLNLDQLIRWYKNQGYLVTGLD